MMDITTENAGVGTSTGRTGKRMGRTRNEASRPGQLEGDAADPALRRAKRLGWFSIGLGLAQMLTPRGMSRLTGVGDQPSKRTGMFAVGLREITAGVGILSRKRPSGWLWTRVAGDLMDLAMLGSALNSRKSDRGRVIASLVAVGGVTYLDCVTALALSRADRAAAPSRELGEGVTHTVTINRPLDQVYAFWRNLENLPTFMSHLKSVQVTDDRRSHWTAIGPANRPIEWDAEITEDRPNELISWRSAPGADVPNAGTVRFAPAPGGRGTEVHVYMQYAPPAGKVGALAAKLMGKDPAHQVATDLRRFKQVMELGQVVHSDASIHRGMHPARPDGKGGV